MTDKIIAAFKSLFSDAQAHIEIDNIIKAYLETAPSVQPLPRELHNTLEQTKPDPKPVQTLQEVIDILESYRKLGMDWLGVTSDPPTKASIDTAITLLYLWDTQAKLHNVELKQIEVEPCSDGRIEIEFWTSVGYMCYEINEYRNRVHSYADTRFPATWRFYVQPPQKQRVKNVTWFQGILSDGNHDADVNTIKLSGDEEYLIDRLKQFNKEHVNIKYCISSQEIDRDTVDEHLFMQAHGLADIDLVVMHSDSSSWLDTENLEVGGHNILRELESHIGKHILLEVEVLDGHG